MKKTIFFHIGYPKTGTTTLQKAYFPSLKNIFYLGNSNGANKKFLEWRSANRALFYADAPAIALWAKNYSESLFKKASHSSIFLSSEFVLVPVVLPWHVCDGKKRTLGKSPQFMARLLKQLFDENLFDIKIITTIRRQCDILPSMYAEDFYPIFSKIPQLNTFERFVDSFFKTIENQTKIALNYFNTVNAFADTFGKENIQVLPFELFKQKKEVFFERLAQFIGFDIHDIDEIIVTNPHERLSLTADGTRQARGARTLFDLFRFPLKPLLSLRKKFFPRMGSLGLMEKFKSLKQHQLPFQPHPGAIVLSQAQQEKIMTIYKESNQNLAQAYSLDLEAFDYY